jgi:uncharacterized protein
MNPAVLEKAVALIRKVGHVFVATADKAGRPHVAAAGKLDRSGKGRVRVSAWFCPTTMANIGENPRIALVVWDPSNDLGYQLLGETERVTDIAMMDGLAPAEERSPLPQVEREFTLRVERVLEFTHAPHSDLEERT